MPQKQLSSALHLQAGYPTFTGVCLIQGQGAFKGSADGNLLVQFTPCLPHWRLGVLSACNSMRRYNLCFAGPMMPQKQLSSALHLQAGYPTFTGACLIQGQGAFKGSADGNLLVQFTPCLPHWRLGVLSACNSMRRYNLCFAGPCLGSLDWMLSFLLVNIMPRKQSISAFASWPSDVYRGVGL